MSHFVKLESQTKMERERERERERSKVSALMIEMWVNI